MAMDSCVFCKIVRGDFNTEFFYEDEKVVAFKDLHPQAKVHVLVIPREHVEEFAKLEDDQVLVSMRKAVQSLIEKFELQDKGYKIEANGGGAQLVNHLHFHLLGYVPKPKE
jgi:histidine triad (HIT) family protein